MADIFISYAHEDEKRIQPLICSLENKGWSVFWDKKIQNGQNWRNRITNALNNASCVIAVWSLHSINSAWIIEEAEVGKSRDILISVLLDAVNLPLGFNEIQRTDLVDWGG